MTLALMQTVEQIDEHLTNISNIIRFAQRAERVKCFARADKWLDRRLLLRENTEDAS